MTQRLLVAYDQSPSAERAFEYAQQLAAWSGGELHVVAVWEPSEQSRGVRSEGVLEAAREHFRAAFDRLREQAGATARFHVRVGAPSQQILRCADDIKATHIVVGQRGRDSETRTVGSVSLRVFSQSPVCVTVIR